MRIAVVTDSHLARQAGAFNDNWRAVRAFVAAEAPALWPRWPTALCDDGGRRRGGQPSMKPASSAEVTPRSTYPKVPAAFTSRAASIRPLIAVR